MTLSRQLLQSVRLKLFFNIILSSAPGSPKWSHSLRYPHQNTLNASPIPIRATLAAHLVILNFFQTSWGADVLNSAIFNSFHKSDSVLARFWRAFGISGGGWTHTPPLGMTLLHFKYYTQLMLLVQFCEISQILFICILLRILNLMYLMPQNGK